MIWRKVVSCGAADLEARWPHRARRDRVAVTFGAQGAAATSEAARQTGTSPRCLIGDQQLIGSRLVISRPRGHREHDVVLSVVRWYETNGIAQDWRVWSILGEIRRLLSGAASATSHGRWRLDEVFVKVTRSSTISGERWSTKGRCWKPFFPSAETRRSSEVSAQADKAARASP